MINNFVTQMINKEENVSPDSRWLLANRNRNLTKVSSHACFYNIECASLRWGVSIYVYGREYNVESILRGLLNPHLMGSLTPKEIPSHINSVSRTVFFSSFFKSTRWYASTLLLYGGAKNE